MALVSGTACRPSTAAAVDRGLFSRANLPSRMLNAGTPGLPRGLKAEIRHARHFGCSAVGKGTNEQEKKTISREEEPDEYWQTPSERKGENPAKDPIAIIGIAGILLPFIILGIAIATGVVDVNAGKP